jgi:copper transport protein
VFTFNEPVATGLGAIRVYDERGGRVDRGPVLRPDAAPQRAGVALRSGLSRGIYTATYRVVSADGHPVSGGASFGVGVPATHRHGPSVAELVGRSGAGAAVDIAYGVVRGVHFLALLTLVGAVLLCARAGGWPRAVPLLRVAAVAGLACALAGFVLQALLGAGQGLGQALDAELLRASADTRAGAAWALRAGGWLLVAELLLVSPHSRVTRATAAVAALGLAASLPLAGHAWTQSPRAVLLGADLVHVLAAGAWLGGLVVLLAVHWPRRAAATAAAVVAPPEAWRAAAAFSRIALPAMAALIVAGGTQAWFLLTRPGDLVDGRYGLALAAKIVLLGGILGLAVRNRRLVAGALDRSAGALRRAMRAEVALAVAVLAATAVLVRTAPPASIAAGPIQRELDLGPMRLELVIEPARTGPNDAHLYFYDRRTGAQLDRIEELRLSLTHDGKGIGPIVVDVPRKSFAHYELNGLAFAVTGDWKVRVRARVSEFDEYVADTEVRVRAR